MDIRCKKCGEPWEMDSLHDLDGTFKKNFANFKKLGCGAFNQWNNQPDAPCDREPIMSDEYMEAIDVLTDLNIHPDDLASDLDSLPLMLELASRK